MGLETASNFPTFPQGKKTWSLSLEILLFISSFAYRAKPFSLPKQILNLFLCSVKVKLI